MKHQNNQGVDTSRLYKAGKAYFKWPLLCSVAQSLQQPGYTKWISFNSWFICYRDQKDLICLKVLQSIKVSLASQLDIRNFQAEMPLFRCISHIIMPNLVCLSLSLNHLKNIESLTFLNCPHLSVIYLSDNQINNVSKVFSKLHFPQLHQISLQDNYVDSVELNRLLTFNRWGKRFQFSIRSFRNQKLNVNDISFLAKCQTLKMSNDQLKHTFSDVRYIKQKKCGQAIFRKGYNSDDQEYDNEE